MNRYPIFTDQAPGVTHHWNVFFPIVHTVPAVRAVCCVAAMLAFVSCGTRPSSPVEKPVDAASTQPLVETVLIPGGTFQMGSPRGVGNYNERPAHEVTLSAFYIGKYEVSQAEYFEVTGERPSNNITNSDAPDDPDGWKKLPVEMISWYEALVFCNKLSTREGYTPVYRISGSTRPADWGSVPIKANAAWDKVEMVSEANGWRLPTEAEWEYAARGGAGSPGGFNYAGSSKAEDVSWHYENSDFKVHRIGSKKPNALNLYDMSGNVMEWCWDWIGEYKNTAQQNPTGPISGSDRCIRGGAWSVAVLMSRCAYRHNNIPYYRAVNVGLRIVRRE